MDGSQSWSMVNHNFSFGKMMSKLATQKMVRIVVSFLVFLLKLGNETKSLFFSILLSPNHTGLGMCVYEWRPKFAASNEVGIELEVET